MHTRILYVGNLASTATSAELRELFAPFGPVTNSTIALHPATNRTLGFAFLEMIDGAQAAITALNGASFQGRILSVSEARPNDETFVDERFLEVSDRFAVWCSRPETTEFREAWNDLEAYAATGRAAAARQIADWLTCDAPDFNPEEAYKWSYIASALEGDRPEFDDRNHSPPYYSGPVGDFRNEALVSDLVVRLGFEKVRALDEEARQWLADRNLSNRVDDSR